MWSVGTDYADGVEIDFSELWASVTPKAALPVTKHADPTCPTASKRLALESHMTLPRWGFWETPAPVLPRGLRAEGGAQAPWA